MGGIQVGSGRSWRGERKILRGSVFSLSRGRETIGRGGGESRREHGFHLKGTFGDWCEGRKRKDDFVGDGKVNSPRCFYIGGRLGAT